MEKASWLAYAGLIIFLLNAASGVLIFYLKIGRCVVIRKCYARMSDPASNDKLTLEMLVSDGGCKIFIWDFDKGVAIFSEGITGKQSKYIVQGEKHAGISILSEITRLSALFMGLRSSPVEMVIPVNPLLCFAHCARGRYS